MVSTGKMVSVKGTIFLVLLFGIATGIPVKKQTRKQKLDHPLAERRHDNPFVTSPFAEKQGIPSVDDVEERGRVVEKRRSDSGLLLRICYYTCVGAYSGGNKDNCLWDCSKD